MAADPYRDDRDDNFSVWRWQDDGFTVWRWLNGRDGGFSLLRWLNGKDDDFSVWLSDSAGFAL